MKTRAVFLWESSRCGLKIPSETSSPFRTPFQLRYVSSNLRIQSRTPSAGRLFLPRSLISSVARADGTTDGLPDGVTGRICLPLVEGGVLDAISRLLLTHAGTNILSKEFECEYSNANL